MASGNKEMREQILAEISKNPLIQQFLKKKIIAEEDMGFIKSQVELYLDSVIDIKLLKDNLEALKLKGIKKDALFDLINDIIQKYYYLWQYQSGWGFDKIIVLKSRSPHETQSKISINGPVIEQHFHEYAGYLRAPSVITMIIPMWNNIDKMHKLLIKIARKKGHVVEFLWKKEAISADVDTTAECFKQIIDTVYNSIISIYEEYITNKYNDIKSIRIITCSAGVAIPTGAIKKLYEDGKKEVLDSISEVILVGMAASFAYCYMYGARTKHIGKVVQENGVSLAQLESKFAHMAPIYAIPALNSMKGKVTWITSASDSYFPVENQTEIKKRVWETGNKIRIIDIPDMGHIGISLFYYIVGSGLGEKKSIRNAINSLLKIQLMELVKKGIHNLKFPEKVAEIIINRIWDSISP